LKDGQVIDHPQGQKGKASKKTPLKTIVEEDNTDLVKPPDMPTSSKLKSKKNSRRMVTRVILN